MSDEVVQASLFNYSSIDAETTAYLKQNAQETRTLLKRTTEDIIRIGQNLMEAKARLPHGQFTPWVKAELGISQPTAWRFMQVARGKEIKKSFTVNDLMAQISAPGEDDDYEQLSDYEGLPEQSQSSESFFSDFVFGVTEFATATACCQGGSGRVP